jgi:hypothetical protein
MGFQGECLQSVAIDDNQFIEIKASMLYLLTPENVIRGHIELSARDVERNYLPEMYQIIGPKNTIIHKKT